jgi:hypothetical protein
MSTTKRQDFSFLFLLFLHKSAVDSTGSDPPQLIKSARLPQNKHFTIDFWRKRCIINMYAYSLWSKQINFAKQRGQTL